MSSLVATKKRFKWNVNKLCASVRPKFSLLPYPSYKKIKIETEREEFRHLPPESFSYSRNYRNRFTAILYSGGDPGTTPPPPTER